MAKSNKLLFTVLLSVVIALLSGIILYSCISGYKKDEKIANLQKDIKSLKSELYDTSDNDADIKTTSKISAESLKKQITSLKAQTNSQSSLINNLMAVHPTAGKVCYLTFDDGPSLNTPKILTILQQKEARGTFFVTGQKHAEFMKNIVNSGNAIGLHCYYHGYENLYRDETSYYTDLSKIQKLVKSEIGYEPRIIRFPGGSSNMKSAQYNKGIMTRLTKSVTEKKYVYFDWNCDSGDASAQNVPASTLINNIKRTSAGKNQLIILMHDTEAKNTTVAALPGIIDYIRSQGYRFDILTVNTPAYHQRLEN